MSIIKNDIDYSYSYLTFFDEKSNELGNVRSAIVNYVKIISVYDFINIATNHVHNHEYSRTLLKNKYKNNEWTEYYKYSFLGQELTPVCNIYEAQELIIKLGNTVSKKLKKSIENTFDRILFFKNSPVFPTIIKLEENLSKLNVFINHINDECEKIHFETKSELEKIDKTLMVMKKPNPIMAFFRNIFYFLLK